MICQLISCALIENNLALWKYSICSVCVCVFVCLDIFKMFVHLYPEGPLMLVVMYFFLCVFYTIGDHSVTPVNWPVGGARDK